MRGESYITADDSRSKQAAADLSGKGSDIPGTKVFRRFLSYYRPHWFLLVADLFCALIQAGIDLSFPQILNQVIRAFSEGNGAIIMDNLWLIAVGMIVLYLIGAGCRYFVSSWGHIMGVRMESDMRRDLFEQYQRLSFDYYDRNKTADMMSRVTNDLFDISEFAHHGPETFIIAGLEVIGSFVLLAFVCWQLTLVMFAVTVALTIYAIFRNLRFRRVFHEQRVRISAVNSRLQDSLGGMKVVRSFGNERYERGRFQESNEEFLDAKKESYFNMGEFNGLINLFTGLLYVTLIVGGGIFVTNGWMPATDLVMYALYIGIFMSPLSQLINFTETFQRGYAGFKRFCEILDEVPSVQNKKGALPLDMRQGEVCYHDVDFSYRPGVEVLQHLDLKIEPGKTVALVGPSGGGKTTVCSLLPRFYDVCGGSITIDGQDIRDVTLESLRAAIGIVQQDVYLFDATIRQNIAYGRLDASDEEVLEAGRRAGVDDFALELEDGYDTLVGERGTRLSGGQKQRISIARMFLKDPAIIVLDEATSALDNESERYIQTSLEELSRGKTSLVIAHRLSTIRNADEIVVIRDGRVEERGTHKDLLAHGGTYAYYYQMQFEGSEE